MPRAGSAAQPGQQLGPVGQLLLDHGAQHRLVDVPVHLAPVDAPNGGWGSYSIATCTIRAVGSSVMQRHSVSITVDGPGRRSSARPHGFFSSVRQPTVVLAAHGRSHEGIPHRQA